MQLYIKARSFNLLESCVTLTEGLAVERMLKLSLGVAYTVQQGYYRGHCGYHSINNVNLT